MPIMNAGQFKKGNHWRPKKPYWDKEWLINEYVTLGKSAGMIASEQGCRENNILYFLHKHDIPRRSMAAIRRVKHWGVSGADNPMWNRKGELNPNWRGGVSADRQAFYSGQEWKTACASVWKKNKATCQRCGLVHGESKDMPYHIHHIVTFAAVELRADVANLVLLCEVCHRFVHSKRNTEKEFIRVRANNPR